MFLIKKLDLLENHNQPLFMYMLIMATQNTYFAMNSLEKNLYGGINYDKRFFMLTFAFVA